MKTLLREFQFSLEIRPLTLSSFPFNPCNDANLPQFGTLHNSKIQDLTEKKRWPHLPAVIIEFLLKTDTEFIITEVLVRGWLRSGVQD